MKRKRLVIERLERRECPAPLTWFAGPNLPTPRGGVVAAIQGGDIAVLGGGVNDVPAVTITNPTWQATVVTFALMDELTSVGPGVGVLPDGTVLLFGGGGGGGGATNEAARYVYAGDGTAVAASMSTPRGLLGFATDQSNLIYAIGGVDDNRTPLSSMEAYTQSSDSWATKAPLPQTLYAESAVSDGAGHLFTFGGVGADGTITPNVYEYTIATNTWTQAAAMPIAVRDSAAILGSNGLLYVLGGKTSTGTTSAVESYNPATNAWNTEASLPGPVSNAAAITDTLGRVEILGGFDAGGNAVANVWISQQLNQPDAVPVITTTPRTAALTANPYTYQVYSNANPQATYALTSFPSGMAIDQTTGLISWTPTAAQVGTFTVTVQASNFAGQGSQTYALTVKQAPPTVPTGLTVTGTGISSISLGWNPSFSPIGISHYNVYHFYVTGHSGRGGGITQHHDLVGTPTATSFTVNGLYSQSQYTYQVAAVDTSGVISAYSSMVTGTTQPDKIAPVFTHIPANQTVIAPNIYGTTDPNAFTATATDPGPGLDSISITYLVGVYAIYPGNVFPVGVTTVTVIAADRYGNSVSGSFTVTVVSSAPVLTLPPNQVVEQASPAGSTDPNAFTATASDSQDAIASITYAVGTTAIDPSYVFPPGTTTVTVTATDTSGNSTSGTFTVTVMDIPPTLSLSGLPASNYVNEGDALNLTATGSAATSAEDAAGLTFTWNVSKLHNGVTTTNFASGTATGSSAPISFVADDEGTFTLTVTAIDVNGASTTQSQVINALAVAPTTAISGPSDGVTYQPRLWTLTASSPSPVDQSSPFSFDINWGDGNTQTVTAVSGTGVAHAYTATGTYAVYVTAIDKDGVVGTAASQNISISSFVMEADPTSQGGSTGLAIGGTPGNDAFVISTGSTSGQVSVLVNGLSLGTFTPTGGGLAVYGGPGTNSITFRAPSGAGVFSLQGGTLTYTNSGTAVPLFNLSLSAAPDIQNLVVQGGNTASVYTIQDATIATTITTGSGNNTITFADTGAATQPVAAIGSAGVNTLIGPNLNSNWAVTGYGSGTLQAGTEPIDTFSHIANLTGGFAADTFRLANNTAGLSGSIDGTGGANTLDLSGRTTTVTVTLQATGLNKATNIGGTFTNIGSVVGGTATTSTLVGPSAATSWTINGSNAGTVAGLAFSSFATLTGGSGADTFAFVGAGAISGTVNGGGGVNTLDVSGYTSPATVNLQTRTATPIGGGALGFTKLVGDNVTSTLVGTNTTSVWNIAGMNQGAVGSTAFQGFADLIGGSGNDTFKLANGAGATGTIDGGAGTNTLDDSAYQTGVVIDLALGVATNLGAVANIANATGGAGNSILVGGGGANVLVATGGNNLIIGGAGADTLKGGSGSDLLISGSTSYDTNLTALQSILNIWSNTATSYAARVAALTSSSYTYHLDSTSVFGDGVVNSLMGGLGQDLFFAQVTTTTKDIITNWRAGETVINI
jgi:hypothetical protein